MASAPAMTNDGGCCALHPVIQLKRRQRRTGEWKLILSICPLCAAGLPPLDAPREATRRQCETEADVDSGIVQQRTPAAILQLTDAVASGRYEEDDCRGDDGDVSTEASTSNFQVVSFSAANGIDDEVSRCSRTSGISYESRKSALTFSSEAVKHRNNVRFTDEMDGHGPPPPENKGRKQVGRDASSPNSSNDNDLLRSLLGEEHHDSDGNSDSDNSRENLLALRQNRAINSASNKKQGNALQSVLRPSSFPSPPRAKTPEDPMHECQSNDDDTMSLLDNEDLVVVEERLNRQKQYPPPPPPPPKPQVQAQHEQDPEEEYAVHHQHPHPALFLPDLADPTDLGAMKKPALVAHPRPVSAQAAVLKSKSAPRPRSSNPVRRDIQSKEMPTSHEMVAMSPHHQPHPPAREGRGQPPQQIQRHSSRPRTRNNRGVQTREPSPNARRSRDHSRTHGRDSSISNLHAPLAVAGTRNMEIVGRDSPAPPPHNQNRSQQKQLDRKWDREPENQQRNHNHPPTPRDWKLDPQKEHVSHRASDNVSATLKKALRDAPESQTESETSGSSSSSSDDSNFSQTNVTIYDDRGRCAKHPHIKLRKKKMLGGWKILLNNCPDCCVEEMLKMRRNGTGYSRKSKSQDTKHQQEPEEEGSTYSMNDPTPPIAQVSIRTGDDRSVTSSSASTITNQSGERSWQHYIQRAPKSENNTGRDPYLVTKMPFTDALGDRGWYSGNVSPGSGLPHGIGQMNYCDGRMVRGRWLNGVNHRQLQGQHDGNEHSSSSHRSSDDSSSGRHRQHHRQQPPPLPRQQQRRVHVVCGMEWTDHEGNAGFFTGELHGTDTPHGMGSMRYHSGRVVEGQWFEGAIVDVTTSNRMCNRAQSIPSGRGREPVDIRHQGMTAPGLYEP